MSASFKTCLFGGFDRQDVVAFIEKTSRENQERIEALETENASLQQQNETMDSELQQMRSDYSEKAEKAMQASELSKKLTESEQERQKLEEEIAVLRVQAAEYLSMKDHIAEIEINAHRRTEEFRMAAIAQLREIMATQRTWCEQTRQQYTALCQQFAEKLMQAQQTVSAADLSAFDEMEARLQALDESLDQSEE